MNPINRPICLQSQAKDVLHQARTSQMKLVNLMTTNKMSHLIHNQSQERNKSQHQTLDRVHHQSQANEVLHQARTSQTKLTNLMSASRKVHRAHHQRREREARRQARTSKLPIHKMHQRQAR